MCVTNERPEAASIGGPALDESAMLGDLRSCSPDARHPPLAIVALILPAPALGLLLILLKMFAIVVVWKCPTTTKD